MLSKLTLLLWCLLATLLSAAHEGEDDTGAALPFEFSQFNKHIFPILGMPIHFSQGMENSQHASELKNIVETCAKVDSIYSKLGWGKSPCLDLPWKYEFVSELGKPLLYWEYSSCSSIGEDADKKNTTLILGGVHADELTPVHMAFKIAKTLHDNPKMYENVRVIVAPLVNPDGFFSQPYKRTNSNGVDLNRNFPTHTWTNSAFHDWSHSKTKDKRKFPGFYANSEQGTRFQTSLIEQFHPDRIFSIHAPLAFLDLDYDNKKLFNQKMRLSEDQKKAKEIAHIISQSAGNYRIKDFGIYPGSLGNYAGNERAIPTITLELSSSDPHKVTKFWNDFSPGIFKALQYEFKRTQIADLKKISLTSP